MLALLLLGANQPVSADRLIDGLWGERPPATAREMVRIYVARLRKRLDGDATAKLITTSPSGYVLHADDDALDLARFERLRADGLRARETGDPAAAVDKLRAALALWRGPPLADVELSTSAQGEVTRLEDLRTATFEERIDAELELGRAADVVQELEALVRQHPYRERLRARLTLALYRAGRQADALAVYRDARQTLAELGLEPTPELRRLEQAVLRHDATLAPPAPARAAPPAPDRPRRRRRHLVVVLAGLACAAAAATVATVLARDGPQPGVRPQLDSVAKIDPSKGRVIDQVRLLGGIPGAMAIEGSHLWVVNGVERTISEFDTRRLARMRTIGLAAVPYRIAAVPGTLWLGNGFDGTISRLDARSGVVSAPFRPTPSSTGRLALVPAFGSLWIGSQDNSVIRVDDRTNTVEATIRGVVAPLDLAATSQSVWALQAYTPIALRIDPETNTIAGRTRLRGRATALAADARSVWVLMQDPARLARVDAKTGRLVATVHAGANPSDVAVAFGRVWVLSAERGTVTEIDPRDNRVGRVIEVTRPLGGLSVGAGAVWVSVP